MDNAKILKLTSGDEIIGNISHADKTKPFVEIANPLKINLFPKMSSDGLAESMALSKWMYFTENQTCNLNKSSIVAISDASIGLSKFYEYCVKKMNKQLDDIEEPTDDELDEMMVEDSDNVIKFPGPDGETIH